MSAAPLTPRTPHDVPPSGTVHSADGRLHFSWQVDGDRLAWKILWDHGRIGDFGTWNLRDYQLEVFWHIKNYPR
ncbi:hypothetical protein [Streptomonospora litoralis]|uniref:Uncharacterized protein n=1 Tax=Streptomonospora litoralis TaxID=2498135 RepID=A0A4P6PX37_9ACTN|nr:hypothetical protein [Streptomonospora litoralis]QBI52240.1 hypothetical protein EKD16_02120 [Streptomonospora litoralis]